MSYVGVSVMMLVFVFFPSRYSRFFNCKEFSSETHTLNIKREMLNKCS